MERRPMRFRFIASPNLVMFGIIWVLGGGANASAADISTDHYLPAYPVKASSNNRYLVDQNNSPFMIVGDSPHSLIGRM